MTLLWPSRQPVKQWLLNSLNDAGLLLWLYFYDYDAESLIIVINVIKVKNNFEHYFLFPLWRFDCLCVCGRFSFTKIFRKFLWKGHWTNKVFHLTHVLLVPLSTAVNRVWNWWKLENGTRISTQKFSSWKRRLLSLTSNYTHTFSVGKSRKFAFHYPKMAFPEFHNKWKAFPNSDQRMFSGEFIFCQHKSCTWHAYGNSFR